ncbi:hypothetical protein B0H67DRAFT_609503 [Lasiosphaeris hirsuta]|uniref:Uncharacterized protein n=1 Tax=Lasiosphaeris hirsuta TaxID=260670 RepID=A0AA40AS68_9PEZI|nr:hypothetical protein B0H67DRAFT_609503 [Lasiosphaeris hirsuta]
MGCCSGAFLSCTVVSSCVDYEASLRSARPSWGGGGAENYLLQPGQLRRVCDMIFLDSSKPQQDRVTSSSNPPPAGSEPASTSQPSDTGSHTHRAEIIGGVIGVVSGLFDLDVIAMPAYFLHHRLPAQPTAPYPPQQ